MARAQSFVVLVQACLGSGRCALPEEGFWRVGSQQGLDTLSRSNQQCGQIVGSLCSYLILQIKL